MAIITSIKPQKSKKRVNIYLDDKFGFGIDLENFMKLHLKVEQELSDIQIEEIVKKAEFQKTLDYLLRFATLRPRSEREIYDWMNRKKVHESLRNDLFDRLKHFELINDQKFARWWVSQRLQFRAKSKRALKFELKMKGISDEVVSEVLNESEIDEVNMGVELLKKKDRGWEKEKMIRFLVSRGFDWEKVNNSVKIYTQWLNKTK